MAVMVDVCLCAVATVVLIVTVVLALSRLGYICINGHWQKALTTFLGYGLRSQKLQSRTDDGWHEISVPEQTSLQEQTQPDVIYANSSSFCNENPQDTADGGTCQQSVQSKTPSPEFNLIGQNNISTYTTELDGYRVSVERRSSNDAVSHNEKALCDPSGTGRSLAQNFFKRHDTDSVPRTGTDMRCLVSESKNVHVLNVGPNSIVNYAAKETQEDALMEEELFPVLCVVQKPGAPVNAARKRTHEPDPDTDCRVLLGVKCDVNSKELMALSFSHSLSKGIVGTDINDPTRNYLIDVDTITNVSTENQGIRSPSSQYWPLIPDPQERTLPRNVCGFWFQFLGPATTFEVRFCLRVAQMQTPHMSTDLQNPFDYRLVELVDQLDISVETRDVRRRRQKTESNCKRTRYSHVVDENTTNRWLTTAQTTVEKEKHTSMSVLPSLSRSERSGTCRSTVYDKIMGRLELLGEEGRWQEFDLFAGKLVKHFETRADTDLKTVVVLEQALAEYYKYNLTGAVSITEQALQTLRKERTQNTEMLIGRAYYLLSDVYQKDKKYGLAEKYMDLAKQVLSNFEIGEDTGETYYNKASLYAAMIANHSSPPSSLFDEVRENLELAICHWRQDMSSCPAHQRRAHIKLSAVLLDCASPQGRGRTVSPQHVEAARRSINIVRTEFWEGMPKRSRCRFLLTESDLYFRQKSYALAQEKALEARDLAKSCRFNIEVDMAERRLECLAAVHHYLPACGTDRVLQDVIGSLSVDTDTREEDTFSEPDSEPLN
ncbi:uncharacterized protein LOC144905351 isoform X1 [Branchiostoma floridae x Branchiostoma belcheri]